MYDVIKKETVEKTQNTFVVVGDSVIMLWSGTRASLTDMGEKGGGVFILNNTNVSFRMDTLT